MLKSWKSLIVLVCSLIASTGTIVAPICWVIPPASPSWTWVWRILSKIFVFPVSTWPNTQMTGDRRLSVLRLASALTRLFWKKKKKIEHNDYHFKVCRLGNLILILAIFLLWVSTTCSVVLNTIIHHNDKESGRMNKREGKGGPEKSSLKSNTKNR